MYLRFSSIHEEKPGEKWRALFQRFWPSYRRWYLAEGYTTRPGYLTCLKMIQEFMPEMLPIYSQLSQLAGGGDIEARFLSLYNPPPYISGCTQLAWSKEVPALIRNYDYHPNGCEGTLLYSNWLRPVIGMSDCCWGLLDGMNDSGLAVSLTFGGNKIRGNGFGIPIILRYICETCTTTKDACSVLKRVPVHMSYNITIIDASGAFNTVFLCPGKQARITSLNISTNHQEEIEWEDYARFTGTLERYNYLKSFLGSESEKFSEITKKFLKAPIYQRLYGKGFGTLYTSLYHSSSLQTKILWPHKTVIQSFDQFQENIITIKLDDGKGPNLSK